MPEERKYVETGGHRYPLKTDAERAASRSSSEQGSSSNATPEPRTERASSNGGRSYSVPSPHGNRTVVLAMLISFGTYALAGPAGAAKLARLQGYLGKGTANQGTTATQAIAQAIPGEGGGTAGAQAIGSVFTPQAIFGWMALFTILIILADFDTTSDLAGAFAMLIMLSTLITLGPDALRTLQNLTTQGS